MEKEITQLEKRVAELVKIKNQRIQERLVFPLDIETRNLLNRGVLVSTGKIQPDVSLLFTDLLSFGMEFTVNNRKRVVVTYRPLHAFTSNFTTDVLSNSNGSHNLNNDDRIALTTTDTLPGGLDTIIIYYVINRTGTTFKLSTSSGGSAMDITNNGIGTHYWGKI